MKEIAIAILNWNGKHFLEQFLPTVIQFSPEATVYVIDNASTDGSLDFLHHRFPDVKTITLDKNYGFCKGYNLGIQSIDEKYVVLLNSDVEVTPHWLEPQYSLLESNPTIAAVQPKVLDFYQRNKFEHAGASGGYIDKYGNPFCRGRLFDNVEEDQGQYDEAVPVFWATGACLMIRTSLFKSIGGFREIYFAHMEEIDVCWRLQNLGHSIYVQPQSVVYHVGGGTLHKINPQKTFLNFRNCLLLVHYNFQGARRAKTIFARLCLDGLAGVFFLLNKKPAHTLAIIRAHFAFYTIIWNEKRIKQTERNLDCMYMKSVTFQYFLFKKKKFSDLGLKIPNRAAVSSEVFP